MLWNAKNMPTRAAGQCKTLLIKARVLRLGIADLPQLLRVTGFFGFAESFSKAVNSFCWHAGHLKSSIKNLRWFWFSIPLKAKGLNWRKTYCLKSSVLVRSHHKFLRVLVYIHCNPYHSWLYQYGGHFGRCWSDWAFLTLFRTYRKKVGKIMAVWSALTW